MDESAGDVERSAGAEEIAHRAGREISADIDGGIDCADDSGIGIGLIEIEAEQAAVGHFDQAADVEKRAIELHEMTGRLREDRALVGPNARAADEASGGSASDDDPRADMHGANPGNTRAGVARTVKTYFAVSCEDAVVGEVKVPLVNNNIRSGGRGRMVKGQRVSDDRCIGRSDHGKISQLQGHVQRDVVEYAIVEEQTTGRATNGSVVE